MKNITITIVLILFACPVWATTYYMAPASGGGNDASNGISASTPWLTPNHAVNCGDVILAAAGSYSSSNFIGSNWGKVTCAAGNNVAWLKCATFDTCKISGMAGPSDYGMNISSSYWGVQGWEIDGSATAGACFQAVSWTGSTIHHIIFANNIANGCGLGGFAFSEANQTASDDYIAVVGNMAYNSAGGTAYCASGIYVYEPIASDSLSGTHIYVAGNFAWNNINGACNNGAPSDGEGINFDTFDGDQTGTPMYSQQVVADNNILLANGGPGLEVFNNSIGTAPYSTFYLRHNTAWGNNAGPQQVVPSFAVSEILVYIGQNVQAFDNIAVTNATTGARSQPTHAYQVSTGNGTDIVSQNVGYAAGALANGIYSSAGFSFSLTNLLTTNPSFASATVPGAPNCGSFANVPACMATTIANFTPTAAAMKPYGYQMPAAAPTYDPLFPQWLCNVNLPSGLVTMGCLSASSLPAPVTITNVTIQ